MVPTTSRAPLSAPPIQQSFSTQSLHQPTQRSVSHSIPPHATQHAADPVQTAVKPSTTYMGSSAAHSSMAMQLTVAPPLNGPLPFAPMVLCSTLTSAYPGAQGYVPTRPATLTSASAYVTTSAHATRPTVIAMTSGKMVFAFYHYLSLFFTIYWFVCIKSINSVYGIYG